MNYLEYHCCCCVLQHVYMRLRSWKLNVAVVMRNVDSFGSDVLRCWGVNYNPGYNEQTKGIT
jgi:hypothetical protein